MDKIYINHNNNTIAIWVYSEQESISNYLKLNSCFYEKDFLEYIRIHHPIQRGIIDIGANIGNHTLFFSKFIKHDTIHSFEPYPDNVVILKKNIGNTSFVYDVALSDTNAVMPLYNSEYTNNGGFSLECYSNSYPVLQSISVRTLDSYELTNISMIKIDVESHELRVLEGARNTIINNKPIIFIEDLSYNYPQFAANRYDLYFKNIDYYKKDSNIVGSMMDLWIPKK